MKKEFFITDEWISYEIHPDTPKQGTDLSGRFPPEQADAMTQRLQEMGTPYGLTFGKLNLLANSRNALQASEFARDEGRFHEFHQRIFEAYFRDGRDIGDDEVLYEVARLSGLDVPRLQNALSNRRYEQRLYAAQQEGQMYEVTGTPTFIINDTYKLVGAQPPEVFRQAFRQLEQNSGTQ
ncbi:DsbA family protein [Alicyclobacillus sp. SO9]|nr:DsbA family protein [Alicyclobacillus sp. SO9]